MSARPLPWLDRNGIQARLALGLPESHADALLPRFSHPPDHTPTAAAVLVPVINRAEGPTLMLTQRTAHLNDHAGQISFPGGRVEQADAGRAHTALRETEEETGLHPRHIEILGHLPEWDIQTGYRVTPVVGWIEPPFELRPDPFEVAEVFEVPLAFLLNPDNHRRHSDVVNGRHRHYYSMPYEDRYIWGATAGMIHTLYRVLTQ
ncbi:MAG: CoA pyrophosphatase [Betaproteobacteria bacterium]|nr:CoA pyrophosphatase [Betaproteobacteria bacterium]